VLALVLAPELPVMVKPKELGLVQALGLVPQKA
jgi:hypothetical protein